MSQKSLGSIAGTAPSGLSQCCFLVPWLLFTFSLNHDISELSWWNGGLFISSVCVATVICFFSLLQSCWNDLSGKQSGVGVCFMGYLFAMLISLTMLDNMGKRVLLNGVCWMRLTVCLFFVQSHQLSDCFSIGEMIVCAELLSSLLWFVVSSQLSLPQGSLRMADLRQLLYCVCC